MNIKEIKENYEEEIYELRSKIKKLKKEVRKYKEVIKTNKIK